MLTTCPECRTSFRLSHSQLEARRGLVRCGFCRAVFNAYDTLLPEFEAPGTVPESETQAPAERPSSLRLIAELDDIEAVDDFVPAEPRPVSAGPAKPFEPVDPRAEMLQPWQAAEEEIEDEAFVLHLSERVGQERPPFEPPAAIPASDSPDAILLSDLPTRDRIEPARGIYKPILLGMLGMVLILTLFAQAAYFFRGPLAAWMPELRPLLDTTCRSLGCRIPLASELSAIRIEASSLETDPEQANRATLRVSFSNRSRMAQAWPYFILRLTDWKGAALAQRAFGPADYLAKDRAVATGMQPMSEHEFHFDLDLGGLSASGFEVIPKYP